MMNNEPKRRDVLRDLLNGKEDGGVPTDLDDLNKLLYRDPRDAQAESEHRSFRLSSHEESSRGFDLEENEEDVELDEHRSFRLSVVSKKKSTIYFSRKMHARLKYAKYQLRKMMPNPFKSQVSMSNIVNNALKIVLHEFESKHDKSVLLKVTMKNMKKD